MTLQELDAARKKLDEACDEVLKAKGADYAGRGDRLSNFKQVAAMVGITPMQAWAVYFLKHVIALTTLASGKLESEPPLQRFVDARNYVELGFALWEEEQTPK